MEGERGNQRVSIATPGQRPSDNMEEEEEYESSDDDDMYLEPGEPYGAFLAPTDSPYDRKERVDTLNQNLQKTQTPERHQAIRVRIREELNQYFYEDSDSESVGPGDDNRLTRPSYRSNRASSPRYPLTDKQHTSDGQKRSISGVQRAPSSRRSEDDQGSTTNNNRP